MLIIFYYSQNTEWGTDLGVSRVFKVVWAGEYLQWPSAKSSVRPTRRLFMGRSISKWKKGKLQFVKKVRKVEGLSLFLFPLETWLGVSRACLVYIRVFVGLGTHHEQYLVLGCFARELNVLGAWLWISKMPWGWSICSFPCDQVISRLEEGPPQGLEEEDRNEAV